MNLMNQTYEDDLRIAERAAQWHQRLALTEANGVEDAALQAQLMAWLEESPRHVREFLLAQALELETTGIDAQRSVDVERLIEEAGANVVALKHEHPLARTSKAPRKTSRIAALAAGVVIAAGIGLLAWRPFAGQTYRTEVGEQRTMSLADGSVVDLNTGSRVKVQLSKGARDIQLLAGEALFKVAQDPGRPFRVYVDNNVIQALGTQFNVNRLPSGVRISVIEGSVSVRSGNSGQTVLRAGEEALIAKNGALKRRPPQEGAGAIAAAWREHRLVFREDTLEDIAAEFNRYNRSPKIQIEDAAAGARRYGGIFNAEDPRSLAQFVADDPRLKVAIEDHRIVIRSGP